MHIAPLVALILGCLPSRHSERGLSQSTENVILLVGAVAIASLVIALVMNYVQSALVLVP